MSKYQIGEKVFCVDGPLLYEAKCIKATTKDNLIRYYVHYTGWNKRCDEWVPETRVLKFNRTNIRKQNEMIERLKAQTGKKPRGRSFKLGGGGGGGRDSKKDALTSSKPTQTPGKAALALPKSSEVQRKTQGDQDPTDETDGTIVGKVEAMVEVRRLMIPDGLKTWLAIETNLINRQNKLFNLPAKITVNEILHNYVKYKSLSKTNTPGDVSEAIEMSDTVKQYFNFTLERWLLYNVERPQLFKILSSHPHIELSGVYGATHFLRLFVRLHNLLLHTPEDGGNLQQKLRFFDDILEFLHMHTPSLFNVRDYDIAPPELPLNA